MQRFLCTAILILSGVVPTVSFEKKAEVQAAERTTLTPDQLILEEYKAVRAEIILCLQNRVTVVSLGFAALGVLLAGGTSALARENPHWFISAIIIGVGMTITSLYVFDVWVEETERLARASYHNCYLELKLQTLFPRNVVPLEWEQRLRKNEVYRTILSTDKGTPVIFLWASAASTLSGLVLFWIGMKGSLHRLWAFIVVSLAVGLLYYLGAAPLFRQPAHLQEIWQLMPGPS